MPTEGRRVRPPPAHLDTRSTSNELAITVDVQCPSYLAMIVGMEMGRSWHAMTMTSRQTRCNDIHRPWALAATVEVGSGCSWHASSETQVGVHRRQPVSECVKVANPRQEVPGFK